MKNRVSRLPRGIGDQGIKSDRFCGVEGRIEREANGRYSLGPGGIEAYRVSLHIEQARVEFPVLVV